MILPVKKATKQRREKRLRMIKFGQRRAVAKAAAAAVMAFGVLFGGTSIASAQTMPSTSHATVTVWPSTNLRNGELVAARVTGFAPHERVAIVECAVPSTDFTVCGSPRIWLTTDRNGNGWVLTSLIRTFPASVSAYPPWWGTVNCNTITGGCMICAVNATKTTISAPAAISFTDYHWWWRK
jgi:neocarzinostatin family protein